LPASLRLSFRPTSKRTISGSPCTRSRPKGQ
jgi:hypothetical protein